jgi:hypothetical protein
MTIDKPIAVVLCALALQLTSAMAQVDEPSPAAPDPNWPCDQVLVPRVAAAVVWDGPPVDGLAWREVAPVADLVARITPSATSEAAASAAIAAFADGVGAPDRDRLLTLAFAGVLEVLNQDRQVLIEGIKRYSRDQAQRAETLGDELDQLVRLEQDPSAAAAAARDELKKRLTLEERAFDEREKSLPFLCTRPVVVEQRLGFLARTIAGHLQ